MKLRYRIETRGWYVPQYLNKSNNEWTDFTYKDLGGKETQLHTLAIDLGHSTKWDVVYHFAPLKKENQKLEDMSLIFKTEIKVCAFLGATSVYFSKRIKDFEPILSK